MKDSKTTFNNITGILNTAGSLSDAGTTFNNITGILNTASSMNDAGTTFNNITGILNTASSMNDAALHLKATDMLPYDPNNTAWINHNSPLYIDINNPGSSWVTNESSFVDPVGNLIPLPDVYPFEKSTVNKRDGIYHVELAEDGGYYQKVSIPTPTLQRRGVLPEELLLIAQDYLECHEELSDNQQQAVKHIKYAMAFLAKHILNQSDKNV